MAIALAHLPDTLVRDTQAMQRRLDDFGLAVDNCPDDALYDAHERVREVKAYLQVKKAARELRLAALRLECRVYRRLGRYDEFCNNMGYRRDERQAASWYAQLTDDEFNEVLAAIPRVNMSPVTIWRSYEDVHREAQWAQVLAEPQEERRAELELVALVCDELEREGVPFFTYNTGERLATLLRGNETFGARGERSPIVREGLSEVMRQAVMQEEVVLVDRTGRLFALPRFITDLEEFPHMPKRVPWRSGSVSMLHRLAEQRRVQAAQLVAKADQLEEVGRLLDPEYPWSTDDLGPLVDEAIAEGRLAILGDDADILRNIERAERAAAGEEEVL